MQNLRINYRIYPTNEQEAQLRAIAGGVRYVHNLFLGNEIEKYKNTNTFNWFNNNSRDLTKVKKYLDWLTEIPAVALQQSLRDLDQSLTQSLPKSKNRKGFPKYKSKKDKCSFNLVLVSQKRNIKGDKFYIPTVGDVTCKFHRLLPSDFKSARIYEDALGIWYISLVCQKPKATKTSQIVSILGIDLNSKEYVYSDGTRISMPKFLKQKEPQIKAVQRKIARSKKGSNNRKKLVRKLAKIHYHIRQRRLNFFHQLSASIAKTADLVCLENLNVKDIQMKMGRVIADNGFAMFRHMIEYKMELHGKYHSIIDRYYPSTKTCSCCGAINHIKLNKRTYECNCGLILDRDLNAAINIERAGTAPFNHLINKASGATQIQNQSLMGNLLGYDAGSYVI